MIIYYLQTASLNDINQNRTHSSDKAFHCNYHQNQPHQTHHHIITRFTQDFYQFRVSPIMRTSFVDKRRII